MSQFSKVLWGIVLVVLGVIIGSNSLGFTNIDIFFDGFWTLFIIVPCFIGLFNDSDKKGNIIGLIIGVALLLACQDIVSFELIGKLIIPFILIMIGLSFILNDILKSKITSKVASMNKGDMEHVVATFSGQKVNKDNELFEKIQVEAIFGGVSIDLRDAKIAKESVIKATSIFGGIDILVPHDVTVKVKSTSIFGGVDNKSKNKENDKIIYVDSFCLFGGVEIK